MAEYISTPKGDTKAKDKSSIKRPHRYKVLLLNDDFTTREFVVDILEEVYRKNREQAVSVMLNIHEQGKGVAGVYVKSIAETKISTTHKLARDHGFPLKCAMEPE
jgi:ATP-dependent Clp protease adaptor protein ClpS